LLFSRDGSARQPLTPISNVKFLISTSGQQIEFIEEHGEIVAIQFNGVGFDVRLPRVREGR